MRRPVLYFIIALALVLCTSLPMATAVMSPGIVGDKETEWSPADGHPKDVYLVDQMVHYSLWLFNDSYSENMTITISDKVPLDPDGYSEIPGVTVTYWWNDVTHAWDLTDPGTPVTILPRGSWNGTFNFTIRDDDVRVHPISGHNVTANRLFAEGTQGIEYVDFRDPKEVRVIHPIIELEKSVAPSVAVPGQNVTYTFTITNTGDWPLEDITLSDDVLGDLTGDLPPGLVLNATGVGNYSCSLNHTYQIQAGDLPLVNTATVWGMAQGFNATIFADAVVTDSDTAEVGEATIGLEKWVWNGTVWDTADSPPGPYILSTYDPVTFRFDITNDGDVALNVTLADLPAIGTFYDNQSCTIPHTFPSSVAANGTLTVYGQMPWAAGPQTDTGTVTGYWNGNSVNATDPANYFGYNASLALTKWVWNGTAWENANVPPGPYIPSAQGPVTFRFDITNSGDLALNVTLADLPAIGTFYDNQSCNITHTFPTSVAANGTLTVYGQTPWAAGPQIDTGTVTGYWNGNSVNASDPANYFGSNASIALTKWVWNGTAWENANVPPGPYIPSAQGPVTFKFDIINNGNVALNVTLADLPAIGTLYDNQSCNITHTFPTTVGANGTLTVYGQLPWADGPQTDTGTVTGYWNENSVNATDPANYLGYNASIALTKWVWNGTLWHNANSPPGPYIPSTQNPVTFRFDITNNGGVALNVTLADLPAIGTFYDNQSCNITHTFPTTVAANGTLRVYGQLPWASGQQADTSTVTGYWNGNPVSDTDPANYFGERPMPVGWESYPVNKMRVLLPLIALLAAIIAGASLLALRRRRLS